MSTIQQLSSLPPRYFWRRVAAYLIDLIIIEVALILFFLILSIVTSWNLSVPLFQSSQCSPTASGPLIEKIEAQWPLKPGETRVNELCHVSWLGSDGYYLFLSSVSSKDGATTYARSFSAAVDKNGNPIDPGTNSNALMSDVVLLIIPLALAYGSANGRRTPGKRLLSLHVATVEDSPPGFRTELKREALKFLPLIILSLLSFINFFVTKPGGLDFDLLIERGIQTARDGNLLSTDSATTSILLPPIVLTLGLIWWIYPLIIWRGQTFYDRFSNCKVLKA
ncbi:RDD family protein [Rhizobium sp. BK602]|uniref:RDD family protein n=1 Tax=Rhizobium sp. BK602 TaxID=2586986 RepID=UPI00161D556C|nr:RDD family protein [Rhizobium sp. BK602]MBB3607622.1 putative RDD family membrane protein YckC [Rhizobium sp. BK602]